MRTATLVLVACVAAVVSARQTTGAGQMPPPATAVITGVVIDGATNAPVENALVYLSGVRQFTVGSQSRQLTDAKGRFAFVNLPASPTYVLTAGKPGYLDGAYGRDDAAMDSNGSIAIRDGEWVSDVKIAIWHPAAISGVVVDEAGEPEVGIYVRVLSRIRVQGRDELAAGPVVRTDDRGVYRIAGLSPGRYLVEVPSVAASAQMSTTALNNAPLGNAPGVSPAIAGDATTKLALGRYPLPPPPIDGHARAYPITFYPGARSPSEAEVIDLHYNDEHAGVDVKLSPVITARVSGTVDGPPEALANLALRLIGAGFEGLSNGSETATALVAADGTFTFLNVPAGAYVIDAPRTTSEFSLSMPSEGVIGAIPAGGFPAPAGLSSWSSMGSIAAAAPPGVQYTTRNFRGDLPNYWGRALVTVNGSDVSGVAVKLQQAGTLTGQVVTDGATVLLPQVAASSMELDPASASPALGELQTDRRQNGMPPDPLGSFTIHGLLAGEYFLRCVLQGWIVKSITWNGKDYAATPFDASVAQTFDGVVVTLAKTEQGVAGVVHDESGAPAHAAVIVFPADHKRWINYGLNPPYLAGTFTSASGSFRFSSLSPVGDYLVIAVDLSQRTAWQDPEFLAKAEPLATRVTIAWGDVKTIDLTIKQVPR